MAWLHEGATTACLLALRLPHPCACPCPCLPPPAVVLTKDGNELARLGEEAYFGERALINAEPRAATATGAAARWAGAWGLVVAWMGVGNQRAWAAHSEPLPDACRRPKLAAPPPAAARNASLRHGCPLTRPLPARLPRSHACCS